MDITVYIGCDYENMPDPEVIEIVFTNLHRRLGPAQWLSLGLEAENALVKRRPRLTGHSPLLVFNGGIYVSVPMPVH